MLPKRASASDFPPTTDYKNKQNQNVIHLLQRVPFLFLRPLLPPLPLTYIIRLNFSSLCFSYYQIKKNILQMLLHTAQNSLP
jgi:hypothetical protein